MLPDRVVSDIVGDDEVVGWLTSLVGLQTCQSRLDDSKTALSRSRQDHHHGS